MCDLWKYTTNEKVPTGAIVTQIKNAIKQLPSTKHIKLYNAGSFFDTNAIPYEDYPELAELLQVFETVIVESHPKILGKNCISFKNLLKGKLEVAIGLETTHPKVLQKLNKKTDLNEFRHAVQFLSENQITSRAFILLRPPFLTEEEGITWAKHSIDFAFDCGIQSCTIIPTRAGNGAMDFLEENNYFTKPKLSSLQEVLNYGVEQSQGNVFADLWDLELFSSCTNCFRTRKDALIKTNHSQVLPKPVLCSCTN